MLNSIKIALIVAAACCAGTSNAEQGDWLFRIGLSEVAPKSDNSDLVNVDSGRKTTFNATYFFRDNWAIEILAALPVEHDINLNGGPQVADTQQLPPTVSVQYHFLPERKIRPYVGLGINYTLFFKEDTEGPLDGADLQLDDSVGISTQVGFDIDVTEKVFLNFEARYIDIDTDASLDGVSLGTVEIDPLVYGFNVGFRL